MSDQTDPNDVRDESLSSTTRRGALAALGLGGLAALSGSASADVGGGPASDAMSADRVPLYRVAESDLDSPGVVGRRVEITSGGSTYSAGDQLVDTGSSWELIDSNVGSLKAEESSSKSTPASYHVKIDGQDIIAVPQNNEATSENLEKVTQTDIGQLLEDLIINQLPPQGEILEATGKILLKRGEYPGNLSNGTYNGVPLPTQCHIVGEAGSHMLETAKSTIPAETPPVKLNFSDRGFFAPDVNSDFMIYPRLADVELIGPGNGSNGSIGLDDNNSNPWDWAFFDRVVVQRCDVPVDSRGDAMVNFHRCQFLAFAGQAWVENRKYLDKSTFATSTDGASVAIKEARFTDGGLHGVGEAVPWVTLLEGGVIKGARFEKLSGTDGNGTAVKMDASNGTCSAFGNVVDPQGDWNQVFQAFGGDPIMGPNIDNSNSSRTYEVGSGADEPHIYGPEENGLYGLTNARVLLDGVYGLNAGSPSTGGNWNGNGKRGVLIEDYNNNDLYVYMPGDSTWYSVGLTAA